ncbi:MFS transporter [Actinoallomurus bryophytorum]|uniref:Putative MFS family arabinose efflux permease n=1 Tax=Actinoallomurus bryophytorum TaxID=1490222 RepID=A0A543CTX0_9ACTN|nr:MFS transporter [Actinoallomurus bryophytorum]TQM00545.1 putative MFS family arabinose efflux permease [Actinoallomurus bryophytorum]
MVSQWAGRFGGRDFVRLWAATTASSFGTTLTTVALPLVALVTLHASTFAVGLISAAELLSWLVLGLSAGVWVDRLARRPLMVACDLLRAVALVSVPVAVATGMVSVPQLVLVALVLGVASVFFDIAGQTYLPLVVEADGLLAGNSRLQAGQSAAQTGGPAVGGALAQLIGAPLTLLVDVASYLFSALFLSTLRTREEPSEVTDRARMLPQIREGLRHVLADPVIRPLMLVAAGLNMVGTAYETLLVPFLLRTVEVRPALIGVLLAVGGVGGVLGGVLGPRVAARLGGARTMVLTACVCPLISMLAPLSTAGAGLVLLGAGLVGREVCITVFSLLARSYRQATVSRVLLARVTASIRFISWGVLPIGALLGGSLGELAGNRAALWAVCGLLLLTPLPLLFSDLRGRRDLPEAPVRESQPA